ncbi:hypothetical protein EYF80_063123 [Liparis tanakae]|uniref:Polycystin cation channel PKD1/PKD2 domain-containing protein n=1 Tax=Liparis tanakae TaxID=230148 RepID=A0A4Z2ED21_9TELE|nr:hypothetical protein EYF80_063123 [Liparis tanakae]
MLSGELWSAARGRPRGHWAQLLLALLSLATAVLQFCSLSRASCCVSELRSHPDGFVDFLGAALLARRCSQSAAVLLTLLVLKLLGTLRFVRRWVVFGEVLRRARRELRAAAALLLLLLLLAAHLGTALFSGSVEGFLTPRDTGASVLSVLRGRAVLRRLCGVHPVLGPVYGLLVVGGSLWLLARLCGAVLLRTYRYTAFLCFEHMKSK